MELVKKYFPHLTDRQLSQLQLLDGLYREWNAKINVISRRDIDNLYLHHVLHSMAIGKMLTFRQGMKILDLGTGGGFPGIPLAILFPEAQFRLIDGTGKKVMVAQEVIKAIGLENCEAVHLRGEDEHGRYQYVVSRAVMPLPDLVKLVRKNIAKEQMGALPNGILVLKGGDVSAEVQPWRRTAEVQDLQQWFPEPWFEEKRLIYLPV